MANFRQIHTRMWAADNWFINQNPDAKLLFIYFFSNERAPMCGLYEIPLRIISFETGLDRDRITKILESFIKADKVAYDFENGVIWVKNMMKYQTQANPNEKVRARIKADVDTVPDCPLKRAFLDTLSDTLSIGYRYDNDTIVSVLYESPPVSVLSEGGGVGEGEQGIGGGRQEVQGKAQNVKRNPQRTKGLDADTQSVMEGEVFRAYEQNIGALTPLIADALKDDIREFSAEWVLTAIETAVRMEKRNQKYVAACLRNWKRDGLVNPSATATKPKESDRKQTNAEIIRSVANAG